MRILVTGATGFVGKAVLRAAGDEDEIVAVASAAPAEPRGAEEWVEADLADPGFAAALPGELDAIVHLAQSRRSGDFPDGVRDMVSVNVASTAALLDHAVKAGANTFVFASTATVYRRSAEPLSEGAELDSSSFYAATKLAAELLIDPYGELLSSWRMRLFTVYGPGQRGRLIADLAERVRSGKPINVQGARGLMLSPIHVDDVATSLLLAARTSTPGARTLNVGGTETLGIAEIASAIGEVLGIEPELRRDGDEEPGGYVADRRAFDDAFGRTLEPRGFRDGIAASLAARV